MQCTRTLMIALAVAGSLAAASSARAIEILVPEDFPTIQAAIDASSNGDVITVATGTWFEAIDFAGRRVTVRSVGGPEDTIIDATGQGAPVVTFDTNENNQAILEGFTLTGGSGTSGSVAVGGGIYINASSPIIRYCIIRDNAADEGGAIFMTGAIFAPAIENCLIHDNQAPTGGAISARNFTNANFLNTAIVDNSAVASLLGGGLGGGAIYNDANTAVFISNSIVEGNVPTTYAGPDNPIVRFSNFEGGAPGAFATIDANPQFVNRAAGNYRLLASSPCVDSGDSVAAAENLLGDLDGATRAVDEPDRPDSGVGVFGLVIDMGPYEVQVAGGGPTGCLGDLNGDHLVGFLDLVELLTAWGPCP